MVAGYVPILTHPERLSWIKSHYGLMQRLVHAGVWMQMTAGSLTGHVRIQSPVLGRAHAR